METTTHLKRSMVADIPLQDMDVRPPRPLLGYLRLSSRLVPNEADDSIVGVAGQLVQEPPLLSMDISSVSVYIT